MTAIGFVALPRSAVMLSAVRTASTPASPIIPAVIGPVRNVGGGPRRPGYGTRSYPCQVA